MATCTSTPLLAPRDNPFYHHVTVQCYIAPRDTAAGHVMFLVTRQDEPAGFRGKLMAPAACVTTAAPRPRFTEKGGLVL